MQSVKALDTTLIANDVQARIHRAMSPSERVRLAVEMSEDARGISAVGVRRLHPDWPEQRVRREVLTRIYGAELVGRAWGPISEE